METHETLIADRREEEEESDENQLAHSQRSRDAEVCIVKATSEFSHKDDQEVMRDIREQMKRTPEDIEKHFRHTEGTALRAAILAGKEALTKGKSKQEVAAIIESTGGDICGREAWTSSASIFVAEAFVIGTRVELHGTPQEAADLQYMCRVNEASTAASSSQQYSSSAPITTKSDIGMKLIKKRRIAETHSSSEDKFMVSTGDSSNCYAFSSLATRATLSTSS